MGYLSRSTSGVSASESGVCAHTSPYTETPLEHTNPLGHTQTPQTSPGYTPLQTHPGHKLPRHTHPLNTTLWTHIPLDTHTQPPWSTSRRYASSWNASCYIKVLKIRIYFLSCDNFCQNFLLKVRINIFSHLTIGGQVRTKCSSSRVLQGQVPMCCIVLLIYKHCVQAMKIKRSWWIKSFQ